jgi:hypothetical protein
MGFLGGERKKERKKKKVRRETDATI